MAEVDVFSSIERASRELGLSPEEESLLEYIVTHLRRARVLRQLVERWYGEQLRRFPQQAYDNTVKLLARVLRRVLEELRRRRVDYQALDLAIAFEIAPDFDRGAAESSMLAREILETVMAERAAEALEEGERLASELERFAAETVSSLEQTLSELKRVSPEAYRRVVERLTKIAREAEELGSKLELSASTVELAGLKSEIERLKKELERVRRELEEVRRLAPAVRESKQVVRALEAGLACPGGEEPLSLEAVWGVLHAGEEVAEGELAEFRRWLVRNWERLGTEARYGVFGGICPPTPTLTDASRRLWNEVYQRFESWFRGRFPALAAILEQMPSPIDLLRFYALCFSPPALYRVRYGARGARLEIVPETSVLRELRTYARTAMELAPAAPQLLPVEYPRRYSPFKLYVARYTVNPELVLRAIGGACPACGGTSFSESIICGGDCVSLLCKRCLASYVMCVDGTRVAVEPTNWDRLPGFKPEWRKRLEEWAERSGWRVAHRFTC